MSSYQVALGNAILDKLTSQPKETNKTKQVDNKKSKQKDQSKRSKDQSKRQKTDVASNKEAHKFTTIALNPTSHDNKPVKSVDVSQNNAIETLETKTREDRDILLEEIKKLGGTEEDLELILFSDSDEEEIHEDSQVDPKLMHDLQVFIKDLDFTAVMGQTVEQDQNSSQTKTEEQKKKLNIQTKRKKITTTSEESCSDPSTMHKRKEKKKHKSK